MFPIPYFNPTLLLFSSSSPSSRFTSSRATLATRASRWCSWVFTTRPIELTSGPQFTVAVGDVGINTSFLLETLPGLRLFGVETLCLPTESLGPTSRALRSGRRGDRISGNFNANPSLLSRPERPASAIQHSRNPDFCSIGYAWNHMFMSVLSDHTNNRNLFFTLLTRGLPYVWWTPLGFLSTLGLSLVTSSTRLLSPFAPAHNCQ
ncbi:unnamed protein product [Protopolystoma xenopodis]|uniref:Uncharacterized protein n=1 Tax=Protopolystoma xenopodis TaxID=117903 RepID=A0A448XGR3_9PLAT|nr:unnamed protein product [Protopolystoma xenopodis]